MKKTPSTKKRGRGRPALITGRRETLTIRITPANRVKLATHATKNDCSISKAANELIARG